MTMTQESTSATPETVPRVSDPVCGMAVDPATSKHRQEHAGATYHFCSAGCRSMFIADPARYLAPARG